MYRNQNFAAQTLTDAGTVELNASDFIEDDFEGTVIFLATGTKTTGTFSASAQLQGSNDNVTFVDEGSPVVMADTVPAAIKLSGTILYYAYYKVVITGAGTQSTEIVGNYTSKRRN